MYNDVPDTTVCSNAVLFLLRTAVRNEYSSSTLRPVGLDRRSHDDTHFVAGTLSRVIRSWSM